MIAVYTQEMGIFSDFVAVDIGFHVYRREEIGAYRRLWATDGHEIWLRKDMQERSEHARQILAL